MPSPSHCPYRAQATVVVDASSEAGRAELPMRNKRCGCWIRILTSVSHHWRRCQSTRYTAMNHSQCFCLFPSHFSFCLTAVDLPPPQSLPSRCPLMHLNGPSHSVQAFAIIMPTPPSAKHQPSQAPRSASLQDVTSGSFRINASTFGESEHAARSWDLLGRSPVPRPWLSAQMLCCLA